MKKWAVIFVAVTLLAGLGFSWTKAWFKTPAEDKYRQMAVTRGGLTSVVNATGAVQPVEQVQMGTFVSGPILDWHADFNARVKKGDPLAEIDPQIYDANVQRDTASLENTEADVLRVTALLQQAINNEKRSQKLRETNPDFISDTEMDQWRFSRASLEAQLKISEAQVKLAAANLKLSKANLQYTKIISPVDGVVIDRKIERGQTVAASFQTPVLFVIGANMDKYMNVQASVDESEIGHIRSAQEREQPVRFTVDAYPDDLFEGKVAQVRLNSATTQNVVTYTVIVEAPNHEMKLLPGMTANLSFQIEKRDDVIRVPNAALRFYPRLEQVRLEDRKLLEGTDYEQQDTEQANEEVANRSATEKHEAARQRNKRHVWVVDGDLLKAIPIVVGLSDNTTTELVEGDLKLGQLLVTGVKTTPTAAN